MHADPVLVTGATGNVGVAVVAQLLARGGRVRAGVTRPERRSGEVARVEQVRVDFTDPATFGPALAEARQVFLVRPPAIARVGPTLNAFIDAAAAAGVEHVVFSSVAGAEHRRIVPHHRIETHLARSGLAWTMLRPGFFPTLERLLGRRPRDLDEYIRDHLATWVRAWGAG